MELSIMFWSLIILANIYLVVGNFVQTLLYLVLAIIVFVIKNLIK